MPNLRRPAAPLALLALPLLALPTLGFASPAPRRDPFEGSWLAVFPARHPNERVVMNFRRGVMSLEVLVQIEDRIIGGIVSGPYRRASSFMQVRLTKLRVDAALVTPEEKAVMMRTQAWHDAKAHLAHLSTLGQSYVIQSRDRIYFPARDPQYNCWLTRVR